MILCFSLCHLLYGIYGTRMHWPDVQSDEVKPDGLKLNEIKPDGLKPNRLKPDILVNTNKQDFATSEAIEFDKDDKSDEKNKVLSNITVRPRTEFVDTKSGVQPEWQDLEGMILGLVDPKSKNSIESFPSTPITPIILESVTPDSLSEENKKRAKSG